MDTRKQYYDSFEACCLPNWLSEFSYQLYCVFDQIKNGMQSTLEDIHDKIGDVNVTLTDINQTLKEIRDKI